MIHIAIIDLVSFLSIIVALIVLWRSWKRTLSLNVKLLFLGLLVLLLLHDFSNVLEWAGITKALDTYEDFIEILVPVLWFLIFYAFLQELSANVLQESEQYFRTLLQTLHEDIMVIDSDYLITDVNHTFLIASGFNRKDVIGRHCYSVSHGYNEPCFKHGEKCMLREVFETGEPYNYRHEHQKKDGSKLWVDILLSPMKDEEGKVSQVVEAIRDFSGFSFFQGSLYLLIKWRTIANLWIIWQT